MQPEPFDDYDDQPIPAYDIGAPTEQPDGGGGYVTFLGGPMDGYRMPVGSFTPEQRAVGVAHICDHGQYGPGGRALYSPPEGDPMSPVWTWDGDGA